MSYKIMIVDDEPIIRLGLQQTIPWEKYQIEIVETAFDGADAIRKIGEVGEIDLVLSDVRMPNMDGLQLASYLQKHHPNTKTMLISGYDEFDYAKKAIQSGVKDYLLKPVDIEELETKVKSIISEIQEEYQEKNKIRRKEIKNAIYQQVYHLPENTVYHTGYRSIKIYPFISTVKEYFKQTGQRSEQNQASFHQKWKDAIKQTADMLGIEAVSIFIHSNQLLTCLVQPSCSQIDPNKIAKLIADKHSYAFVWSDSVIAVADLKEKFNQLKSAFAYLPLVREHDFVFSNYQFVRPDIELDSFEAEKELLDALSHRKSSQSEQISLYVSNLFSYFQIHSFLLQEVIEACSRILKMIVMEYETLLRQQSADLQLHFLEPIDLIFYNSYSSLQELFQQDVELIKKMLNHDKLEKADWLIKQAEEYIREYYCSTIKVQEVADVINVSPNYFSSLFKQKTGENFNEYVNKLRVEEAKSLLVHTPFKVSEIAKQVGFQEYKYFVRIFKKFSGLTPTNYRKLTTI